MVLFLLAQTVSNSCSTGGTAACECVFGGLNQNGWIWVNMIIVVLAMTIGGLVYAMSGFAPSILREKLRGAVRYELVQGAVSFLIIGILLAIAFTSCEVGASMVQHATGYVNPIQYSEIYLSTILFQRSTSIFARIYAESVQLVFWGNVADQISGIPFTILGGILGFDLGAGVVGVFFGFSGVLTTTFSGLLAVTFGLLFIIYAFLPLIASTALTVIVPLAIILRSIPFAGPRLRESADSLLAIAITFYFIFPLTLLFNYMLVGNGTTNLGWLYTQCKPLEQFCNPNYQFLKPFQLTTPNGQSLFNYGSLDLTSGSSSSTNPSAQSNAQVQAPLAAHLNFNIFGSGTFFGSSIATLGGLSGSFVNGIDVLLKLPEVVIGFAIDISQYLFQAIALLALDLAITVAFGQGLAKGLGAISRLMAVGPVWS